MGLKSEPFYLPKIKAATCASLIKVVSVGMSDLLTHSLITGIAWASTEVLTVYIF